VGGHMIAFILLGVGVALLFPWKPKKSAIVKPLS